MTPVRVRSPTAAALPSSQASPGIRLPTLLDGGAGVRLGASRRASFAGCLPPCPPSVRQHLLYARRRFHDLRLQKEEVTWRSSVPLRFGRSVWASVHPDVAGIRRWRRPQSRLRPLSGVYQGKGQPTDANERPPEGAVRTEGSRRRHLSLGHDPVDRLHGIGGRLPHILPTRHKAEVIACSARGLRV